MKKNIFIKILVLISLILGVSLGIVDCIKQRYNKVSLRHDHAILGYGETYNPIPEETADVQKIDNIDDEKKEIENEEEKEYLVEGKDETTTIIEDKQEKRMEQKLKIKVVEKVEGKSEEPKGKIQKEVTTKNETNNSNNKVSNPTTNSTTKEEIKNNVAKQDEKQQDKKEEIPNQTTNDNTNQDVIVDIVQDASKCKHEEQKYFNSEEEAIAFCKNTIKQYGDDLKSGKIKTYEEYAVVCPYGYETMSCPYCGKWTMSFYYNKN